MAESAAELRAIYRAVLTSVRSAGVDTVEIRSTRGHGRTLASFPTHRWTGERVVSSVGEAMTGISRFAMLSGTGSAEVVTFDTLGSEVARWPLATVAAALAVQAISPEALELG